MSDYEDSNLSLAGSHYQKDIGILVDQKLSFSHLSSNGAEQGTSTSPSLWAKGYRLGIHSCPLDGDVKWQSCEQDWELASLIFQR